MPNENRDHRSFVTQKGHVAGALSATSRLKPITEVRGERNLFEIGDHYFSVTQGVRVASAEPTRITLKPKAEMSARAPIPIGGQLGGVIQTAHAPGERSANVELKPRPAVSSARAYSEIGDQCMPETHCGFVPDVDRRTGFLCDHVKSRSVIRRLV